MSWMYLAGLAAVMASAAQAADDWRAARGLDESEGTDIVRVRTVRVAAGETELIYALPAARGMKGVHVARGRPQDRVVMGNAPVTAPTPGLPRLPVVPARILLPAGHELVRAEVVSGPRVELPGAYQIEYEDQPVPLDPDAPAPDEDAEPNAAVYGSDAPYPGRTHDIVGVYKKRGASILYLNLYPVEYRPRSGRVTCAETMSVRVVTKPTATRLPANAVRPRAPLQPWSETVDNPEAAASYQTAYTSNPSILGFCNPSESYAYVIVTGETIKNASDPYAVTNLLAYRRAQGLTATIVTMEQIRAAYSGVDDAERLRNFIRDAYNNWETDFVLLAGDINVVPMRKLWCQAYPGGVIDEIPSDLYFQCLDGDYNFDGDRLWGEPTDGENGGDVDLLAEVYIGRASAETPAEMANFVFKTIAYENESEEAAYLHRALMCGEYLGFDGPAEYATESMEEIRLGSDAHGYTTAGFAASEAFTVETLYDTSGYTWLKSEILSRINSGRFGIINHLGHANYNYVMKFYYTDADTLTNTAFLFAYSQGCLPGNFELDCVAEHLTTSTRYGMFAVVFNSRYGWGQRNSTDGPSQRFNRQFWDAYFAEQILLVGELTADSHEDNAWAINNPCMRWCYYTSNLLGDPRTPMRGQFLPGTITLSPKTDCIIRGGEGGPFSPTSHVFRLRSLAQNETITWSAFCTQSWVSVEPSSGTLAPTGQILLTVFVNNNAETLGEGWYADTLTVSNVSHGAGSTTRGISLLVSNPPRVTNSTLQAGDILPAGALECAFEFSKPMRFENLDPADFSLTGVLRGETTPATNWVIDSPTRLVISYTNLPEDRYTLRLRSQHGAFEDLSETLLDGETTLWPIPPHVSGDGVEGGDFLCTFDVDAATREFPMPLVPLQPLGSLVYQGEASGFVTFAGAEDRYTLALDANQQLAVIVESESSLQLACQVLDASNTVTAVAHALAVGQPLVLPTMNMVDGGIYTVVISGLSGTTGRYTLRVLLNAACELESYGGSSNDAPALAENIENAFVGLPSGAQRAAVVGYATQASTGVTLFSADFESGLNGFMTNNSWGSGRGLWHRSFGRCYDAGHSPTASLYYGRNEGPAGGGNYDNGWTNSGLLTSPVIALPENARATLSFNYLVETEGRPFWDICAVEATNSARVTTLLASDMGSLPTSTTGRWLTATADLGALAGTSAALRFTFDTVDANFNNFEGWYVDDVRVTAYGPGQPDWYSFAVVSGQVYSVALAGLGSTRPDLELHDDSGLVAVAKPGGSNVSRYINAVVMTNTGTGRVRVAGADTPYNLIVLRDAVFEIEPNDQTNAPQPLSTGISCLASISPRTRFLTEEVEPNDDGRTDLYMYDLPFANDWSGSFTNAEGNRYMAEITGAISRRNDEDWYSFVASPGDVIGVRLKPGTVKWAALDLYTRAGLVAGGRTYTYPDGTFEYIIIITNSAATNEYFVKVSASQTRGSYALSGMLMTPKLVRPEDRDFYKLDLEAGSMLNIRTWTPGDGSNEFRNLLTPCVEIYAPNGALHTRNSRSAPDGRNVELSCWVPHTGPYLVCVRAAAGTGEYVLDTQVDPWPPSVYFGQDTIKGYETNAVLLVPVFLAPPTSTVATVEYRVTGGTAVRGEDFQLENGVLTFQPGQASTNIVIEMLDDALPEGTETIEIELFNPIGVELGPLSRTLVRIRDDEVPMQVKFSAPNYTTTETVGLATVTVVRVGGSDGEVSVTYVTSNGTARAGYDYGATTGQVFFGDGVATQTFGVAICEDFWVEGDETVLLYLRNVVGEAILGAQSNATLTIQDVYRAPTGLLRNVDFETPLGTEESAWKFWGPVSSATWAARSGQLGAYFDGAQTNPSNYTRAFFYQAGCEGLPTGRYTFAIWVRQERGFCPITQFYMEMTWRNLTGASVSGTAAYWRVPSDNLWHHIFVTGTCTSRDVYRAHVYLESMWITNRGGPSALMFDDAELYMGSYTGAPQLANGGFEQGLAWRESSWRGSSWSLIPEGWPFANSREPWAARSGEWGGALLGDCATSNDYTTIVCQNLVPGTGAYTFAMWIRCETNFALSNTSLRLQWYDTTFTNKVRADSVKSLVVPNDGRWRPYHVEGWCTNSNLHELRVMFEARHRYAGSLPSCALMFDDACLLRGLSDADADGDGLPDVWEQVHFGNATNATSDADSDGDGANNMFEYVAGTDPGDPLSCFQLRAVSDWMLEFPCSAERAYDVLYRTNLLSGEWMCLRSNVVGWAGYYSLVDTNEGAFRAYRIRARRP